MLLISDVAEMIGVVGGVGRSIDHGRLAVLPGVEAALKYHSWGEIDLVLLHRRRDDPAAEVCRLLRVIEAARGPIPTLVLGEPYDAPQALELFRMGVADYIGCPIEPAELAHLIRTLTAHGRLRERRVIGEAEAPPSPGPGPAPELLVMDLPEGERLMAQVRRVAPLDATILIGGESGTGKARLARLIHDSSGRRSEPFLAFHCGSLPAGQVERELFGDRDRPGRYAEARSGTLFLDEVALLPPSAQARLLRAVEERTTEPTGPARTRPNHPRLIVASNRMLEQEVAAHRFRSDLFYRLNVVSFDLPPLRERRGSIPALARRFLGEFAARHGRQVASISGDALRALEGHDWPGNLREFREAIERAVAIADGREIGRDDLPGSISSGGSWEQATGPVAPTTDVSNPTRATLDQVKRDAERSRIAEALAKHGNNRLRTASELGISRMTLYKKLYKHGLMPP